MKIAMLGSGATGSVFASYLKMGGADDIVLVDLYKECTWIRWLKTE